MTEFIFMAVFFIIIEAVAMEGYKKQLRGDGETTKASAWELRGVAFALAIILAFCLQISNSLGMGYWAMIPYTLGLYFGQYLISMKVIKALAKKVTEKHLGVDITEDDTK